MTASGLHAAAHQFREDLGGVAEQADRDRLLRRGRTRSMIASASSRSCRPRRRDSRSSAASRCATRLAFDGEARGARPWSRPAAARRPCRRGRRSGSSGPRGRRHSAGGRPRRRSRRCPARCPACRYRSRSRPSSGRTSSGPCDRARGSGPTSPSAARGWSWRSARAARPHGCGTRRPACPTAPAASRRLRAACRVATMRSKLSQSRAARPMPP